MSRGLNVGACLAILAIPSLAGAQQEGPEPLAVSYEAPDGCPTSDAFFREITARTTRARVAQPSDRARVMHVVVAKRGEEHVGRLWIEDANASSTARSVSGKTCGEVVGALALVGALAVDPRASTAPVAATAAVAAPEGADAASRSVSAERTADPPAATTEAAAMKQERERERPATSPPSTSPPSSPRGRVEVGAQAELAVIAGAVPSGRLFGDLSIGPREGLFAPSIRLAFARSLDVDRSAAIGAATLRWTAAAVDVCPVRVVLARPLAFRPCAGGSAGVLEASGTGFAGAVSRSRPWVTLSALGRLVWEPLPWLDVDLEVGAIAPLFRESFFFAPSVAVYEAPVAAFLGRAGFGVRFP